MEYGQYRTFAIFENKRNSLDDHKKYPAKILLFGEHTVIKGSDALAIPFHKFYGKWMYSERTESNAMRQMDLPGLVDYLAEKKGSIPGFHPDIEKFKEDLSRGMFFQSNIPLGYGAGSSGALCAAIYDQYFEEKTSDITSLKKIFGLMESYFHGSSSGFDPLVCHIDKSVFIKNGQMQILDSFEGAEGLFLVDTDIPRSTGPFVRHFLKCYDENVDFKNICNNEIIPMVNNCISSYLKKDATTLFHQMHDLSRLQYLHFRKMIPDMLIPFWEQGLKSSYFKMKICGAGGGGFLMGISKDMEKTLSDFGDIELIPMN